MTIEIDAKQLKRLRVAVGRAGKKLGRELAAAINAVAKKGRLEVGREVRKTVNIKKDESEKPLKIRGTATAERPTSTVSLDKTRRLGLRHFGAKQDARGVTYKIGKKGGRQRVDGAFQGPKPGVMKMSWKGNAFRRAGKSRLPIIHLRGVSAFGAIAKNNLERPLRQAMADNLAKQMERRIKLNILRAEGLVSK